MTPKVSIWLTTYNHEEFIAEAIESILVQQTSYEYEIIIGEDCSTDATRQIVKSYKERYPEKIKLFLPEKNLGMVGMFRASYELCTGTYIAWMDGDDYWTDPFKIEKQVKFLEAHPEYVLHFHKVNILEVNGGIYEGYAPPEMNGDQSLETKHFLKGYNPVASSSVLHRNVIKELPNWFFDLVFLDYGFYMFLLRYGKFYYSEEKMSIYRVHKGGAYSGRDTADNMADMIRFAHQLEENFPEIQAADIYAMTGYQHYKHLLKSLRNGTVTDIKNDIKKVIRQNPALMVKNIKPIVAMVLNRFW